MKPYPFQQETLRSIQKFNGRCLVALSMGLGKTPIALWYIKKKRLTPTIVVCPASIKFQWADEANKIMPNWKVTILEGRKPGPTWGADIIIINYDILSYWVSHLLETARPQAVILDEVHMLANATKRTRSAYRLCYEVENILALSGTPLTNRPIELYNTVHLLCPESFPSKPSFGRAFCDLKINRWSGGLDYRGSSNLGKLRELLLDTCMIRKRKSEVLKELPPKIRQVVRLDIKNREEYNRANSAFLDWLKDTKPSRVKKAKKAEAMVKVGYLLRLTARLKFWSVVEWVKDYLKESEGKAIIFAQHHKMIRGLSRQIGESVDVIHGGVPTSKRKSITEQFQTKKKPRILIGNIRAAGVGLNLTVADTVIFSELSWKPADHTQAEDRIHRIGQENTSWIYYLVAKGTIEEKLCEIIQAKHETTSAVLDGGVTPDSLDIFSQLLEV